MAVPETTMYENNNVILRKDKIWLSRQILTVEPEAKAHGMRGATHFHFRRGVLAFDPRHQPRSALGRKTINHLSYSAAME